MIDIILRFFLGFSLIILHLIAGNLFVAWTALPVPGSVIGMVLLAASLRFRFFSVARVRPASDMLLRHMALFFVPPGVALMLFFDLIAAEWPAIVASGVVSTIAVLLVVGWIVEKMEIND